MTKTPGTMTHVCALACVSGLLLSLPLDGDRRVAGSKGRFKKIERFRNDFVFWRAERRILTLRWFHYLFNDLLIV